MALTPAQLATLKAAVAANTATVPAGQPWAGAFAGVQVKDVPNTGDGNVAVAGWYNLVASPGFWVWKPTFTRSDVYHAVSPAGTTFDWGTFKTQAVAEQNAWSQMFMGDTAPIEKLNFRDGVFSIFSGSAAQNNQRTHIFACGRRPATNLEKLFAAAPAGAGAIAVGPNNGNTTADALGAATNPALMAVSGNLSAADVNTALNLP